MEKLNKAKVAISMRMEYLANFIMPMPIYPSEFVKDPGGNPTMGVDKWGRCWAHPAFVEKCSLAELAGVIAHEAWHLALCHIQRTEMLGLEHVRANIAQDCEINDGLEEMHIPLPEGGCYPQTFGLPKGMSMEYYYEHLPEFQKMPQFGGSCADGDPREWEGEPGDGEYALSKADIMANAQKVAESIKGAKPGAVPGKWEEWAKTLLQPQVDWRRELASLIIRAVDTAVGDSDSTYARLSRRTPPGGVILPTYVDPIIRIVIVLDTSGSMGSDTDIPEALAEIKGIAKSFTTDEAVRLCCADTELYEPEVVRDATQLKIKGRGGTDMDSALVAASKVTPSPNVLICLTDGETPWPRHHLPIPTVACITSRGSMSAPSWIRQVKINR